MTRWKKYGILFSCIYVVMMLLFFLGALFGVGGTGEDNLFGWLLIFSGYPLVWLLNIIGINAVISSNGTIIFYMCIQGVIIFVIGAACGQLISILKTRK